MKSVYIPITLLDVFELIEDGKTSELYYVDDGKGLVSVEGRGFRLSFLPEFQFYRKVAYTTYKEEKNK